MESFPFNLSLNYKMEVVTIKPPSNFTLLSEVICEKYDLHYAYIFYDNDLGETEIKNDSDYANFLEYATEQNINEIEIYVRSDEQMSQQRKLSLRKRSSMKQSEDNFKSRKIKKIKNNFQENDNNNNINNHQNNNYENNNNNDYEIGMQCDYDYYGDTRNRKGMIDDGYSNQNIGFKERKRIYYIKQKKEMQREEHFENEENENEEEEEEEINNKKHKRKLKNNQKKIKNVINEDDDEKKVKKQSKKGRVMIHGGYRGGH